MISPKIRILKRNQIDDAKWDQAIEHAVNSLPYAYTWYLDALCPRWIALVAGDYEYVMPLPIDRKWGFLYVYQPLFCQQLGVFYKHKSESIISQMLSLLIQKFVFINLNLNYDNSLTTAMKGWSPKKNLIMSLNAPHSEIQKKYNENTSRNIKKAIKNNITFEIAPTSSYNSFIDFFIHTTAHKDEHFKPKHREMLTALIQQFTIHDRGRLYLTRTENGEICAGAITVANNNRIIHLITGTSEPGRKSGAMHLLIDTVLISYENTGIIYDFEGSSVESIARFKEGFGAANEPFYTLNKRPFAK